MSSCDANNANDGNSNKSILAFSKKTSAQNKNALCIESIKGTGLIEKSDFAQ